MKLVVILLSLWADRKLPDYSYLREFTLYNIYAKWLLKFGIGGSHRWVPYVLITVVPTLMVLQLLGMFGFIWPLKWLLAAVMLYFCLPRDNPLIAIKDYVAAVKDNDSTAADAYAEKLTGSPASRDTETRNKDVIEAAFSEHLLHLLCLGFWFVILGVGGLLFYRLNWQLYNNKNETIQEADVLQKLVRKALHILTWMPTKILAVSFAMMGNFAAASKRFIKYAVPGETPLERNIAWVKAVAYAAAGQANNPLYNDLQLVKSTKLVVRTAYASLAVLGVLALIWFK